MKILHLSDLHIGKRINGFSMIEDQTYILEEILKIIEEEEPKCILIAGDIYDKPIPSTEAVQLLDDFLGKLANHQRNIFIISGNHDSPERIAFGGRLMNQSGIYMSPVYQGEIKPIAIQDEDTTINIYMLPFVKPNHVRRYYPENQINSYTEGIQTIINQMDINKKELNLLMTHQFVTGASRCESEEISIGGTDNIDATIFKDFDYVALGHLHSPQNVTKETIRYCGTPLKYSFSEAKHQKSITILNITSKNNIEIKTRPLTPKRDMREIKGSYMELMAKSFYEGTAIEDYIHVILTDEEDIPEGINRLRTVYPNIMKLDYDNRRTKLNQAIEISENIEQKPPIELFNELYERRNNQEMTQEQNDFIQDMIEKIWEDK